jgi:putative transposase
MGLSTSDVQIVPLPQSKDVLSDILRQGAQKMLAQAIEAEVQEWVEQRAEQRDEHGRQQVVRNGFLPERSLLTGLGEVPVQQPRVRDRRPPEQREKFSSAILPPYLRKTRSVEELIPWLYLKGISTGDFSEALAALLGPDAKGLSATTVTRLKGIWQDEYQAWSKRSLAGKQYAYVWADGVHFNIRLEDERQCILVLPGATPEGDKEVIAISEGYRESEQSWRALLLDCKARGLEIEPELAIADGAWASGRPCPRCGRRRVASVVGCTRRPMCWTRSRKVSSRKPRRCCTTSGWRPHGPMRTKPLIFSSRPGRRNIPRPRSA